MHGGIDIRALISMMEGSGGYRTQRGSVSRRLGASSYLLELVPDAPPAEGRNHRIHHDGFSSQHQLTAESTQDPFSSHSLPWGRGDDRPPHHPPPPPILTSFAKCRLSRSKRRPIHPAYPTDPPTVVDPTSSHAPGKDCIIFAESPVMPGVPVVYRPPEDRAMNPDRLNLDRRHLNVCPILEGEDRLRLLNLQHNSISRLRHLSNLRRLVFLDLYDNLVYEVTGLEGLLSLRVLMLGKNRIRKISGLQTLIKLDVLDLHGNMIRDIENLNQLYHLRVLNLAGNEITCVTRLTGLHALTELNLRRNRITHVVSSILSCLTLAAYSDFTNLSYEVDQLRNLRRLFLSHNLIQSFEDMSCLSRCETLSELTLDGNPLANSPDHRPSIIYHVRHLTSLDQRLVSEEERREALDVARQEEERGKELKRLAQLQEHKEAAITAIRRSWEVAHGLTGAQVLGGSASSQSVAFLGRRRGKQLLNSPSLPQLSPGYFVDVSGSSLHLYGLGALEALDSPPHGTQSIKHLHFHYIEFEEIVPWLPKVAQTCPELSSLSLECTNLSRLEQVNALASLHPRSPLLSLSVSPWGNPLTQHPLFLPYITYRLQHFGLTEVNGGEVTDASVAMAERLFGKLGDLTSQLAPARLLALVTRNRPRGGMKRNSLPACEGLKRPVLVEPIDRVTLHYHSPCVQHPPDAGQQSREAVAQSFCSDLLFSTLAAHRKVQLLGHLWPGVLARLVHQVLQEYSCLEENMQALLDQL